MDENKIDSVLGQRVSYPQNYDKSVLVRVERQLNRVGLGLKDEDLPFVGVDTWHAYEISCLTKGGLPVVGMMKIVYPASSKWIVESKSLKLYLNSYNMEKMGKTPLDAAEAMRKKVEKDLQKLLDTEVTAAYFPCSTEAAPLGLEGYETLEEMEGMESLKITQYTEDLNPLRMGSVMSSKRLRVKSHLLRSNCRVTNQPDWGTIYIDMEGGRLPAEPMLLRYLVSLRGENHFHEEICETVYTRLKELFTPRELMVCCLYTRRGGIDICPARASKAELLPETLGNASVWSLREGRS